jgi:hypothetical protein
METMETDTSNTEGTTIAADLQRVERALSAIEERNGRQIAATIAFCDGLAETAHAWTRNLDERAHVYGMIGLVRDVQLHLESHVDEGAAVELHHLFEKLDESIDGSTDPLERPSDVRCSALACAVWIAVLTRGWHDVCDALAIHEAAGKTDAARMLAEYLEERAAVRQ